MNRMEGSKINSGVKEAVCCPYGGLPRVSSQMPPAVLLQIVCLFGPTKLYSSPVAFWSNFSHSRLFLFFRAYTRCLTAATAVRCHRPFCSKLSVCSVLPNSTRPHSFLTKFRHYYFSFSDPIRFTKTCLCAQNERISATRQSKNKLKSINLTWYEV